MRIDAAHVSYCFSGGGQPQKYPAPIKVLNPTETFGKLEAGSETITLANVFIPHRLNRFSLNNLPRANAGSLHDVDQFETMLLEIIHVVVHVGAIPDERASSQTWCE
jgi:hypothetical protein